MNVLRDGLTLIPDSLSTLIHSLQTTSLTLPNIVTNFRPHPTVLDNGSLSSPTNSSSSSMSGGQENHTERAQAIPGSLITEEWQLVLDHVNHLYDALLFVITIIRKYIHPECFC